MKKLSLLILLALVLALVACGGSQPEPTPVPPTAAPPTEASPTAVPPTAVPTEEPAPELTAPEITHQPDPALIDITWQWVSWTTAVDGETPIADPTRYTILFNADGTANVRADCNTLILNYASDNGAISFMQGISTLMSCPDESLEHTFNAALSSAALYFFQDGDLLIDTFADGGTMRFVAEELVDLPAPTEGVATGTVTAPNGVFLRSGPSFDFPYVGTAPFGASGQLIGRSEDQQWWAVAAPSLEEGRVWVSAAFVEAENADSVPVIWPEPDLTGQVWQWVSLTTPLDETAVANPASYTILFNEDGSANIKADCNVVAASYTLDGSAISITPGPTTLVACPEDSLGEQFTANLSAAAIYFFLNGDLYLDLFASSGTMRFVAQEIVELPEPVDPNAPRGTVTAPDGIFLRTGPGTEFPYIGTAPFGASGAIIGRSANGQWWLADTPNLPGGQVWASAQFVEAVNVEDVPVVAAPAFQPALQNVTWQWVSFTTPVEMLIVNDPGRYTIRFNADGTAGVRADCNTMQATYTTNGSNIAILPGPMT
jgi:heat shock protein HslJ